MDNYRRAEHTQRPLTEEERRFAEVHHDLIYRYMNLHKLNPEEWYDILIIPYLDAVKKFHQYERLQNLKFEQIFFRTLDSARSRYWRDMNRKNVVLKAVYGAMMKCSMKLKMAHEKNVILNQLINL